MPGTDVYTSVYGEVEVEVPVTGEHSYGAWTITQDPTLTTGGKAKHTCTLGDNHEEEIDIPALNDAEVWTKDEEASTPATHAATGTDVYTSVYGSVNVTTDKLAEHTWGAWEITQDPTLEAGGKAKHTCTLNDGGEEEKDIPALNDADVWTKDTENSHPATHTAPGTDVYKSEYGTVEVEIPAKSDEHQWSAWSWKDGTEPTEETGATATRSCEIAECNETEEKTVPNLKDASVWECDETPATYNGKGSKVYTSEYGTVTVETAKLVAPYDGKTYHQIDIKVQENQFNGTLSVGNNWQQASLTLDENGVGLGTAYPFSNNTKIAFTMVDPETGKISISFTSKAAEDAEDAEDAFTGEVKTVTGYVDMATGFVLMAYNGEDFTECYLLTPYGQYSSGATASVWGESALNYGIALSYTYTDTTEKTETLYISDSGVAFGVTFTDLAGAAVKAENCYNAAQLYIKKGETVLASLGYNGETMVALDGYEGEYEDATLGKVTLSGVGTLTASKDDVQSTGTYTIAGENTLDLLVTTEGATKSYTATVVKADKSMTATEAKVTVSFNMNDHGTQEAQEGYKNVEMTLPEPAETDGMLFRGWFLEEGCTTPVPDPFKPSEDVTLYAKWVEKLTVKVHALPDQSTSEELEVGVGDNILESLQKYDTSVKDGKVFKDWYTLSGEDKVYLSSYPESVYSAENDNMDLYSEWESAPYAGDYKGSEIYNAGYGSSAVNITIGEDGKISGSKTGTVDDYNEETQIITWTDSNQKTNYFFFDAKSGVLAYNESGSTYQYLGNDMYVLSKYATANDIKDKFGVQASSKHDSSRGWYAQFVEIETSSGKKSVFIYDTHIYSDVTITDAFGSPLAVSAIAGSKTVVVKDSDEEILLKVASQGETFKAQSSTVDLDEYFGTYTKADSDDLTLDGIGNLVLGDKNGTYKAAPEGSSYTFDAYITEGETQVYYELTVDLVEKNYTLDKIMVNVTLNKGGHGGDNETKSYNKNVEFTLPVLSDEAGEYLFRGWFSNEDCTLELEKDGDNYVYAPAEDGTTVYAKWVKKVTITVHLGDATLPEGSLGADGKIDTFGQGEEVTLARPSKEGSKFEGWFKDDSFENPWGEMDGEGNTAVTLGDDVTTLDLYPKWGEAPAYTGEYHVYFYEGSNANGGAANGKIQSGTYKIDAEGFAPAPSGVAWPLNMDATVGYTSEADAEDSVRALTLTRSNGTNEAFIDLTSKIIVINLRGTGFTTVVVLVPVDKEVTEADSYWNEGNQRAITFSGEETTSIFINNGTIHFGVTLEDKDGGTVAADQAYQAERLYVKKDGANVEGIKGFGFNGTTMKELDGKEGDYTYAGDAGGELDFGKLTVNGVGGVTTEKKGKGTYTLVSGQSYTAELRLEGLFYYLTLTLNPENYTYTVEKPMATVTFELVDGTDDQKNGKTLTSSNDFPESAQYNLNTEFTLEQVPEVDGYVFRGWYTAKGNWYSSEELNKDGDGNYVYTPTAKTVTLYAKFEQKITITIHYGADMGGDVVIELAKGESVDDIRDTWPGEPGITNGKRFVGWYKDASYETEWNDDYPVQESIEIYVKWEEIPEIDYVTSGSNKWTYDEASTTWKSATPSSYPYESKMTITFAYSGTYSFDWTLDCDTDAGATIKWQHADGTSTTTILSEKGSGSASSKKTGNISKEVKAGDSFVLTYTRDSNSWDVGEDCMKISNIVWTKDVLDGFEGTYAGEKSDESIKNQELELDGKGGASWVGRTGKYTVKESPENTIELYLDAEGEKPAEYWVITLTKGESTYTAEKPMVKITFETDNEAVKVDPVEYNKNIPVKLPVPESDVGVYTGWYTNNACTEEYAVELDEQGMYTPTEETTLYTKITSEEVTLTIDYGEHGPEQNKTVKLAKGETPELTEYEPEPDNGFVFDGWYEDEDCLTPYTPAPLNESKTIYAKWKAEEEKPYTIEATHTPGRSDITWVEGPSGTWRIDTSRSSVYGILKITFTKAGTFSFDYEAQISDPGEWGDCAEALLNADPTAQGWHSSAIRTGSGSKSFTVNEGDTVYIATIVISGGSGDFMQVSNFQLV